MKLNETEAQIQGSRLIVTFSLPQIISIFVLGAGVVGSVWLATRDLGIEVVRLSKSVDALVVQLGSTEERIDDHENRLWRLENNRPQGGGVGGAQ